MAKLAPFTGTFFVIVTQNPQDQAGTYPPLESQLDRFLMRIELGYPDKITENACCIAKLAASTSPHCSMRNSCS